MSRRRRFSLVFLLYIIIGLVVAWEKAYITVGLLKLVLSALLAIFLWWLVLLGVNLHSTDQPALRPSPLGAGASPARPPGGRAGLPGRSGHGGGGQRTRDPALPGGNSHGTARVILS